MTYDELMAKIDNLPEVIGLAEFKVRQDALRAVVELHKPDSLNECVRCSNDFINADYPCFTIQIIEEQLK